MIAHPSSVSCSTWPCGSDLSIGLAVALVLRLSSDSSNTRCTLGFHYEPASRWENTHFLLQAFITPEGCQSPGDAAGGQLSARLCFWALFFAVFGRVAPAAFAGFLGYLFYDTVHYATPLDEGMSGFG